MRHKCRVMRPPFSFPRKKTGVARPKERRFPLQASSSKSCNACRLHCPVRGVAIRFDLLLSSAVAQPLAALLPYGCGTPLAGAALESERKCSVITCCRWHNIAASAAKPPRQTIASLYKSKVGGNCVRLTNRRQSDSEDRSKPSRLDTKNSRHPIPQAAQLFELLACNANLSLGGSKGGYSLSRKRVSPFYPRPPHGVGDNRVRPAGAKKKHPYGCSLFIQQ